MSIEENEKLAAHNATEPRVSLADIEAEITYVAYMTGDRYLAHATFLESVGKQAPSPDAGTLTICMVSMKNGWMVLGKSAPASPKNFNPVLGRRFAYEDCIRQLWQLLGYRLKSELQSKS